MLRLFFIFGSKGYKYSYKVFKPRCSFDPQKVHLDSEMRSKTTIFEIMIHLLAAMFEAICSVFFGCSGSFCAKENSAPCTGYHTGALHTLSHSYKSKDRYTAFARHI